MVSRNGETEKIGEMVKKLEKNDFPYYGALGHQKHTYVGKILKKSLQGSIHTQFYMALKGSIWSISVAAVYSEHKATRKQVPHSQKRWFTS